MKYNIYLIFNKKKNDFFSNFIKCLILFVMKWNGFIIDIIDFGKIINFKNNYKRLFKIKIFCNKNTIFKIFKLLKIKKKIIIYYIILKETLKYYIQFFNFTKFISKNFYLLPCYINKIRFKFYKKIIKKIKILKMMSIIPSNTKNFLKKINKC